MKKIKNYLLSTIMVLVPSLLMAHPGHEHHGTGLELFSHLLITVLLALGIGAGLFYLIKYYRGKKSRINHQSR